MTNGVKISGFTTTTTLSTADKLPIIRGSGGSADNLLVSYQTLLNYINQSVSGTSVYEITAANSPFTVTNANTVIYADATAGSIAITLADPALGNKCQVFKTDSSGNTVTQTCADNINGTTTDVLSTQYANKTYQSNSTTYFEA